MKEVVNIPCGMCVPCLNRHKWFIRDNIINTACQQNGLEVVNSLKSHNEKDNVDYLGLLLRKV